MAQYFIDTFDGNRPVIDMIGLDFDDDEGARNAALAALPDMARDTVPNGDRRKFVIRVRDENGRVVYRASLTLAGGLNEDDSDDSFDGP